MSRNETLQSFRNQLFLRLFKSGLEDTSERLRFYRRLSRTWEVIRESFDDSELDLATAARRSGISQSYLNNLLRKQTGLSFKELLVRYRLYQAINEMCRHNVAISELAHSVGFKSRRTFERNFQRLLGMSPKQVQMAVKSKMAFQPPEISVLVTKGGEI